MAKLIAPIVTEALARRSKELGELDARAEALPEGTPLRDELLELLDSTDALLDGLITLDKNLNKFAHEIALSNELGGDIEKLRTRLH